MRRRIKSRRMNRDAVWDAMKYAGSFAAVMVIGSLLILWQGENPVAAMRYILQGAFGSIRNLGNTLRWITPCILTGIAAAVAFKSGVMNLGIEGQLYFGAYAAALFGFYVRLPRPLHVTGCLLAAGTAGMVFALLPAVMKLVFHVNEMITTLMLNYIAVLMTEYLTYVVMGISAAGDSLALSTPAIQDTARLTNLISKTNASTGIFIAVGLVAATCLVSAIPWWATS